MTHSLKAVALFLFKPKSFRILVIRAIRRYSYYLSVPLGLNLRNYVICRKQTWHRFTSFFKDVNFNELRSKRPRRAVYVFVQKTKVEYLVSVPLKVWCTVKKVKGISDEGPGSGSNMHEEGLPHRRPKIPIFFCTFHPIPSQFFCL
jgi:hypothetical protein